MLAVCASGRILKSEIGAQPGDRRHDDGGRCRATDGGPRARRGAGLLRLSHDMAGYEVPVQGLVQSRVTREAGWAAKTDDATLTFSGGCEHGAECWRGGEAVAN